MGARSSGEYDGIADATESVLNNDRYPGAEEILSEAPSETEVVQWTKALSGFEANTEITPEENSFLLNVVGLLESSKENLATYAADLSVKPLGQLDPETVFFMVCIRDLQDKYAPKANLNSHKLAVLQGGRYQIRDSGSEIEPSSVDSEGESSSVDKSERVSDLQPPDRVESTVSRIIRNTSLAKSLKEQYNHKCQICGEYRKRTDSNRYAEAHHIQPLGADQPGPDIVENILILCPNHHSDFDYGLVEVDPDTLTVTHAYEESVDGSSLTVSNSHEISYEFLEYHNSTISNLE
ncbi:HNH endonuclease [Natrinema sp. SYSU A 869]|uniref:HNH endonuclease n=1 Tax=Natrinema sp. SYSU A 869 TaxID=2871694 RepID=UPI001CA3BC78|nr:HNH endonuclease [Natrinema sp. SYSU A 869]